MDINLHHSVIGREPGEAPAVVLLHGLFGMGSNLGALARALQDDFRVYSVDLPNHGKSSWLQSSDIPTMARCVAHWMEEQNLPCAHFMGHSLGGKLAMQLALSDAGRVDSLCIADIAPVKYAPHHDNVLAALGAVQEAACQSRGDASQIMGRFLAEDILIQFLLMSIRRNEEGVYTWRFNLAGIIKDYDAIRAGLEANEPYSRDVLFIKGGDSDYILREHRARIMTLFPQAAVKIMPGCGHWLHAQKPRLFNSIVRRFLGGDEG
ncbi:MAG: alpha/beta fold hydrolase [Proteobacteria bacterium]|nr:alpha/beta fold hydrolase [Pseudomonadota bacterium]